MLLHSYNCMKLDAFSSLDCEEGFSTTYLLQRSCKSTKIDCHYIQSRYLFFLYARVPRAQMRMLFCGHESRGRDFHAHVPQACGRLKHHNCHQCKNQRYFSAVSGLHQAFCAVQWVTKFKLWWMSVTTGKTTRTSLVLKDIPLCPSSPLFCPCPDEWPWVSCPCPSKLWETNKPQPTVIYEVHFMRPYITTVFKRDTCPFSFSFLPMCRWGCVAMCLMSMSFKIVGDRNTTIIMDVRKNVFWGVLFPQQPEQWRYAA